MEDSKQTGLKSDELAGDAVRVAAAKFDNEESVVKNLLNEGKGGDAAPPPLPPRSGKGNKKFDGSGTVEEA